VVFGVAAWVGTAAASAQDLSQRATDRCVRAAVKLVVASPGGQGTSTGSGSIIDPRGYVLTNFHVVGHVNAERGIPGTLLDPDNRVLVAHASSARESADPRWVGRVVRADARLDLALVRIVSDLEGRPVRERFEAVTIGGTGQLRPGSRVFAFGFPLGVRTINVTGGQLTGFQMNARDEIAWLRADAEFNPGNSGGMLVDQGGRLIGIPTSVVHGESTLEPIELARPAERIPRSWLAELRRGPIDDVRIDGVPALTEGAEVESTAVGDLAGLGENEIHYYTLDDALRPGVVTTAGAALTLALADPRGRILRRGEGRVEVYPGDPPSLLVAVLISGAERAAVTYRIRADRAAAAARPVAYRANVITPSSAPNPFAGPPRVAGTPSVTPPSPARGPAAEGAAPAYGPGRATVRGRMIDGRTGQPIAGGMVILGQPGMDLGRILQLYLSRRLSDEQFFQSIVGFARTDAAGRYELAGIPSNQVYPAAGIAQGYRSQMLRVGVGTEGAVLELNAIPMMR
jgi:serine protease Do